jgi:3-dehydroquinate synthase
VSELSAEEIAGDLSVSCTRVETYPVTFTTSFNQSLRSVFQSIGDDRDCTSVYVMADSKAMDIVQAATRVASDCGLTVLGLSGVDGNELSKSYESVMRLWREMHDAGVLRRTLILGIGGGVTCDVVGFTASTYMRGLPYALVPTTLMAQVDAGIGGKTGFNLFGQKNLIGSFYHPASVTIDTNLITDLPDRVLAAGLAEVIKVGVVGCPELFELIIDRDLAQLRTDPGLVNKIVRLAVSEKFRQLRGDPVEVGDLRRALNFGHCVGHAIEAEIGYEWLHGECVAAGMAVASRLGERMGISDPALVERLIRTIGQFGLPLHVPRELSEKVWEHLHQIARVRNGRLHVVVPSRLGRPVTLPEWPTSVPWKAVR